MILRSLITKKNIYPLLLLAVSLLIFIPSFSIKFSWIDDGWSIVVSKNIIDSLKSLNIGWFLENIIETSIGRFRPIYWFWQVAVYLVGGKFSYIHYVLHYILIASIVLLIYKLVLHFTKSYESSFVSGLLFLVFPLNAENWSRLGPAEPLMILFILLSLYYYFKNRNLKMATVFMAGAFLTKETSIAIIPVFGLYVFLLRMSNKKVTHEYRFLLNLIVMGVISTVINLLNRKGYSNSYTFDFERARYNFFLYLEFIKKAFPFGLFFVITLMARYVRPIVNFKFKKLRYLDQVDLFFIVGMLAFVAIQAPWAWVLDRYLLPALAMGAIFVGIEVNSITVFLRKNRLLSTIWKIFLVVYLFVFSIYSVLTIYQQMVRQKHSTTNIYDILNTVSQITPKDGKVYFNFKNNDATYEPLFESDLHLKLFFGRNDIKVDFLENLPTGERGYLVVSGTPLGSFKYLDDSVLKVNKNLKSKKMYGNEDKYIVLSDFKTVVKQSAKKLYLLLFKHEKINGSGIYTDYLLKDSWIIYYY